MKWKFALLQKENNKNKLGLSCAKLRGTWTKAMLNWTFFKIFFRCGSISSFRSVTQSVTESQRVIQIYRTSEHPRTSKNIPELPRTSKNTFLNIPEHPRTSQNIPEHHPSTSQYISVRLSTSHNILEHPRTSQYIPEHTRTSWNIPEHPGTCQNIL